MPGWRVGMLATNATFVGWILKVKSNVDSGTFRALQLAAAKELNFHVGTTSIIARQFYEGMKIGNTCTGLITWYKSSKIIPADVQYSPETVKDYLPANHFKLYSLIWQRFHGELSEIKSSKSMEPMIRYNDYLLMTTLEQRGLPWEDKLLFNS